MNLLVCIPTYNEAENIELFIKTVFEYLPVNNADILIVDDNSPDGTAKIVERMIEQNYIGQNSAEHTGQNKRLHILNRPEKQGLAKAYLAAFEWGMARGYDVFLEMDADFSHKPQYIPVMLDEIKTHDVVIGSRNIKGGSVEGWSAIRNIISKGGSLYSQIVLGCPVKDLTGGFNMWRKSALLAIGLENIISKGFSFQVEMKFRSFCTGASIKEIPIVFPDRKFGKSKMSKNIFVEALLNIWTIKKHIARDNGIDQFLKFAITGGLGSLTNLVIFFICVDKLSFPVLPVSILCFFIAATQNYIINHKWSFIQNLPDTKLSIKKWAMFLSTSLIGFAVNLSVLEIILLHFVLPYKFIAQACGIAAGMIVNFVFTKFIVFGKCKR
jgi:dolichol-phosphate mannosyltransferase